MEQPSRPPLSQVLIWSLVAGLFLSVAGLALYRVWPLLHPPISAVAPLDKQCELRRGPCTGTLPNGGRIRFAITPQTLPVAQPLHLSVWLEGVGGQAVEVDFSGVEMAMGYNRPRLTQVAAGVFVGNGMLPVCLHESMTWEARVLVQTSQGLLAAPFRFVTPILGMP